MDWYIVVKTINGRRYLYRQKTWRVDGHVKTRSEYVGPDQIVPAEQDRDDPAPGANPALAKRRHKAADRAPGRQDGKSKS